MIAMVEGAKRQKTPNEIALNILLVALTHRVPGRRRDAAADVDLQRRRGQGAGTPVTVTALIALLVCLIPTTIGALLSAIGVAGMSRMMQANVIATSGRAVEAAGDVDVLLLDKTGTITLGNRQASGFFPARGQSEQVVADVAQLASLADETPEGRSIVVLAKQKFNLREREMAGARRDLRAVHRADAHERRRPATSDGVRRVDPQGRGRRDPQARRGARRHTGRRRSRRSSTTSRAAAARRWSSPTARARSASSSSRTSSRAASRSASPSCAAWASRP